MKRTVDYAKERYGVGGIKNYGSKSVNIRMRKSASLVGSGNRVLDIGCYDGTLV